LAITISITYNDAIGLNPYFWKAVSTPQVIGREQNPPVPPLKFNWKNCAGTSTPIQLASIVLLPDPLSLGKNLSISASGSTAIDVTPDVAKSISLTIKKKVWGNWITIPCVQNIGSCTYQDPCALMDKDAKLCPTIQPYGLPCHCPIKANHYGTPGAGITVETKNPGYSWLADGDFSVQATINGAKSGEVLGCVYAEVTLKESLD